MGFSCQLFSQHHRGLTTQPPFTIETVRNIFKVNSADTRTTPAARSSVFIVNFEHVSHLVQLFLVLTLNM